MSTRYGNKGGSNLGNSGAGAESTGTIRRGQSEYGSDSPDLGRARSDFGDRAYGGKLDESALEAGGTSPSSIRRGNVGRSSRGQSTRGGGRSGNGLVLLLGGLGLGGTLAYMFGPGKGSRGSALARRKEIMVKCGEVMTKDPACCLTSDTVDKAAQLMRAEDVGSVPVVNDHESKGLVGIVTDRDLAIKVVADARDPKATMVSEVMTTGVATCRREDDLQKALTLMEQQQVRRIPIVGEGNRVEGIIAQADVATRIEAPQRTAEVVEEVSRASAAGAS
ncbi:MAG: CBS domain-containing protein [Acidobacteriota bacterium]|nr:CBS domain-containing protein [Acidobacteriota bacterium]